VKTTYDVIVAGAGSAGVPLAARLAEDPARSVLLLDAGPRFVGADGLPPELRYAGVLSAMMPGHPNNWGAVATLRPGVQQPNPRGRVVGGSSALNGALFTRGLPADFDGWAAEGNPEWAYERVLPFFRKLEADQDIQDQHHGAHGPIPVRRAGPAEFTPLDRAFLAACRAAGFPDDPDMNGPDSIGVGALPVNNREGVRVNTALAYLDAMAERPNLTVIGGALVRRILLDGRTAVGVEAEIDGQAVCFHAGEVAVSAGAIRSPQLLMLSGVGPAEELRRVGLAVAHELPRVGRDFTDHASVTVPFRVRKRRNPTPDPTRSTWAHAALHYTSEGSAEASDMMLIQSCIPVNQTVVYGMPLSAQLQMLRMTAGKLSLGKLLDYARNGWDHAITCIMQRDESRGEIRLASADPRANPELRYRYLESETDRRRLRESVRLAARLIDSAPYRELGARRVGLDEAVLASDPALDAVLLERLGTSMHMASSCRMGPSPETSVVDQYCRVHGMKGLRVVDSSIMPTVVRRCPAATAVMIGERAAALFD
jgi:choline dehydrogenase-like flavoprotein